MIPSPILTKSLLNSILIDITGDRCAYYRKLLVFILSSAPGSLLHMKSDPASTKRAVVKQKLEAYVKFEHLV